MSSQVLDGKVQCFIWKDKRETILDKSYHLYFDYRKQSQKDFRLELASHLISYHSSRRKRGRSSDASPAVRFTERHFPAELTTTRQCKVFVALPIFVRVLNMVVHHALQMKFICALYPALVYIIHPPEIFSLSLSFFTFCTCSMYFLIQNIS